MQLQRVSWHDPEHRNHAMLCILLFPADDMFVVRPRKIILCDTFTKKQHSVKYVGNIEQRDGNLIERR